MRVNKPRNLRSTAKYFGLFIIAICLFGIAAANVQAATLTVDTLADDASLTACTAAADDCSLRGAITTANAVAGDDVIDFSVTGEIVLSANGALPALASNVIISGPGAALLKVRRDASAAEFRVFTVNGGVTVTISGVTISGGDDPIEGGGIKNSGTLTINECTLSGNSGHFQGGGIFNAGGMLVVSNSTLTSNGSPGQSSRFGGAGGGICNSGTGTLILNNSTLSYNGAQVGGGISNFGLLTISDSTFSGNSAVFEGGAISGGGTVRNSTLTGNRASHRGGGIFGTANLNSSIVANNSADTGPDIWGTVSSGDYNLIEDPSDCTLPNDSTHNITGVDPMLGPLADNGGPTLTHSLIYGSAAIDKGKNSDSFTTDQRGDGFPRTIDEAAVIDADGGDGTDIGAVESNFIIVVNTTAQDDDGACEPLTNGTDCSLREAIIAANASPGTETIIFVIPTTDQGYDAVTDRYTIALTSLLPNLNSDMSINGLGAKRLTVKRDAAAPHFRILSVSNGRTVTISGVTISGGFEKSGGGISNAGHLTLSNSTVSGNLSHLEIIPDCCSYGGGIYNGGTLIINNSTVSGNSADGGGGGVSNFGTLTISNSTLSGNLGGEGGAIANYKTLTVSNSTMSDNSSVLGGGIYSNTTIHPNLSLSLNTSILANNTGRNGPDVMGTVSSGDYNLIENTLDTILPADSTHNITGVDPVLGPLADNGGPTRTHALLCGSPAVDKGTNSNGLHTDQRGANFARKFDDPAMANAADGDGTDIGAFELQEPPVCNTAPVANGNSYSTDEDTPLSGSSVLANDTDGENDTLTAVLVSGPPNAQSFTLNADGSFSYTPNANFNGSDSFTYKANDGSLDSNVATVTITVNAVNDGPVVSATPDSQSVQYSDPISAVSITATDVDSSSLSASTTFNVGGGAFGNGLPNGLSMSSVGCTPTGSGTSCQWTISGKANVATGTYVIRVNVSDGVLSSTFDVTLVVNKEKSETVYTGDVFMFTAGPTVTTANVRLSAQLTQQADGNLGDITLAKVSFLLFKSSNLGSTPDVTVAGVPVEQSGAALKFVNLGVDTWTIKVKIDSDNGYWKASPVGMGTVTVEQPTNELRTSGGGWIADSQSMNGKGNFGFNVANQKKGVRGGSVYLYRGLDGFNYLVKNTSWQSGGIGFGSEGGILSKAAFSGKCVVQKIDPETGEVVESYGNYSFNVDVRDGDLFNPKQADKYAITVLNSNGLVWRQVGSPANPSAIGGGNITVKAK